MSRIKSVDFSTGGYLGLVFLIFLTLKLAGIGAVATWSWWWVTAPLWIPLIVAVGLLIIYVFLLALRNARRNSLRGK